MGGAEKPVLITFDDGYRSNYDLAYPLLQKYQTKAAIAVMGIGEKGGRGSGLLGDAVEAVPEVVQDPAVEIALMYHHVVHDWQECNEMTVTEGRLERDLRGREYMAVRSFLKKVKGERAKEKTLRPRIMGRKASPSAVPVL